MSTLAERLTEQMRCLRSTAEYPGREPSVLRDRADGGPEPTSRRDRELQDGPAHHQLSAVLEAEIAGIPESRVAVVENASGESDLAAGIQENGWQRGRPRHCGSQRWVRLDWATTSRSVLR